jgi:hypothetical protein
MHTFAEKFKLKEIPPSFDEHYATAMAEYEKSGNAIMDFERYMIFTHLEKDIKRIRDELLSDSDNVFYAYLLNAAIRADDKKAIALFSSPRKEDKSELYDTLPLFSLLYEVPKTVEEHKTRGIPSDVTADTVEMFQNQMGDYLLLNGRLGISDYVSWMLLFIRCKIIRVGRFNLEICKYKSAFCGFSREKELVMLPDGVSFHRSGRVLGSVGCEDAEGAFWGKVDEDEEYFSGLKVTKGVARNELLKLPKGEWRRSLRVGDTVVSVHIPTGGPLTPETVRRDLLRGAKIITECFTEFSFFFCSSWLLCTELKEITGKEGNVTRFGDMFVRFPVRCDGSGVYVYVFNTDKSTPPTELVAENSFARAIKAHLVGGGEVYSAEGILPIEWLR